MNDSTTIQALTRVTVLLALILAFSFVIERILELLKAAFDLADGRLNLHERWTKRARRTQKYMESRLRILQYVDERAAAAILSRFSEMLLGPKDGHTGIVPVLCGDLVRVVWVRAALKTIGCAIGIWFAFSFNLDLLALTGVAPDGAVPAPSVTGRILTGIAIGLGSGIVHKLITAVERKQRRNAEVANA